MAVALSGVVANGFLTGGGAHDSSVASELMAPLIGCYVCADKAYDTNALREQLWSQNCEVVIPGKRTRKTEISYDKLKYKRRSFIETIFGKLKENRRLAMRFEKSDINFLSFVAMALIKINL